ncbi:MULTISPECIES: hypothetical protein [Pseudomonas]|uniref:hypothetical protein n=1 Tax=Pseudomonas TaxID=286 RepID=UPI0002173397|nr:MULTISPECIES: hypothetical protein [Pseudomonas]AEJ11802.1 conserved hypothetical protein [Pseudomonas putida S16]AHZ76033.1 hypothetical protein DW66_1513 [Pseudomonas putida]WOB60077.1 hypothetical protein NY023_06315 [Pseudomonas sp. NBB]
MPTENRSSNTDPRDVFIRLNPLGLGEAELRKDSTGFEDQRTHSDYLLFLAGYRETHAESLQHTEQHQGGSEPVAVLYANGIVLTKADCGDVFDICCKVETPLYTHADPGEAGKWRNEAHRFNLDVERLRAQLAECEAMAAMVAEREWAEHAGTGDISSKVEAAFTQLHNDLHEVGEKLAERDALLREVEKRHWSGVDFDLPHDLVVRIKALSASAEPEAT